MKDGMCLSFYTSLKLSREGGKYGSFAFFFFFLCGAGTTGAPSELQNEKNEKREIFQRMHSMN